jgi:predicted RNase H-like HicB family nuclease
MTLVATVSRDGKFWLAEVPALDAMTQGKSRAEALRMLKSLVAEMVDKPGIEVKILEDGGKFVLVDTNEHAAVLAVILKRQRIKRGLTVRQVAKRLGSKSPNAYAAYESGAREPSVSKLEELLSVVDPEHTVRLKVG